MTAREELNRIIELGLGDFVQKVGSRLRSATAKIRDFKTGYIATRQANPQGRRIDAVVTSAENGLKKKLAGGYGDIPWRS